MSVGNNIKRARKEAKLTQAQLGSAMGITPQAVSQWERGETDPEMEKIPAIALALNVSEGSLVEGQAPVAVQSAPVVRPPPTILGERDLPVYAAAEGGPGEMVVNTDPVELVPRPWYLGNVKDGYAVLIVGDSMEPVFEPGDMAVVNPRLAYKRNKDVILVSREDEGEFVATIKRLIGWTDKEWKLRQFNPRKDFTLSRKEWPKALLVVGRYAGG